MKKVESKSTKKLVDEIKETKSRSPLAKKYGAENFGRAEEIVAKKSGARSEKSMPYGLVVDIAKNAKNAGKTIKKESVDKASKSKTVEKYKTETNSKRKK